MNRLKEARERTGLSQKQVAISLSVSKQAVSLWESSTRTPSADNYNKLAELYSVPVDYLMGRTDELTSKHDIQKTPSTISDGERDDELVKRILNLDEAGRQRVLDFLAGMNAKG